VNGALGPVADALRADGGLLAGALKPGRHATPHGDAVAPAFAVAVEAIREGYLCHYGASRLLALGTDPDLALLAGDRLYALGLAELAATGDLVAVRTMAEVIAAAAAAQASGDASAAERAWDVGTRTLAAEQ
jgi:hypothetical protein